MLRNKSELERKVLEDNGATDIEGYVLVNNYGYRFKLDGIEMDARFVANCYGCDIYRWECYNSKIQKELQAIANEDLYGSC